MGTVRFWSWLVAVLYSGTVWGVIAFWLLAMAPAATPEDMGFRGERSGVVEYFMDPAHVPERKPAEPVGW